MKKSRNNDSTRMADAGVWKMNWKDGGQDNVPIEWKSTQR